MIKRWRREWKQVTATLIRRIQTMLFPDFDGSLKETKCLSSVAWGTAVHPLQNPIREGNNKVVSDYTDFVSNYKDYSTLNTRTSFLQEPY
jgi:hypothetical protein